MKQRKIGGVILKFKDKNRKEIKQRFGFGYKAMFRDTEGDVILKLSVNQGHSKKLVEKIKLDEYREVKENMTEDNLEEGSKKWS